jgi:8-oxo-dGTP pyrophosphatase MutT (NUDIX family)
MATTFKPCTYRVSAKAVITSDKGLLLVKEDADQWDLPGGGIEHFEELDDALRREIQEELGAEITEIDKHGLEVWFTYDHSKDRPILCLVQPVRIAGEVTASPDPNITVGYFTKDDLKTLDLEAHHEKNRQRFIDLAP